MGQKTNTQALVRALETEAKKKVETWKMEENPPGKEIVASHKDFETDLELSGI